MRRSDRSHRRATAVATRWPLAAVLLLAACARPDQIVTPETGRSAAVSAPPSSPAPPAPRCIGGVEITLGETSAAMGLRATGIELRNCGTAPYTVEGYPDLELLDDDRKPLDVRVLHGVAEVAMIEHWAVEPKPITVAPGERVRALLVWRNLTTEAEKIATGAYVHVAPATGQPRHIVAHHVDTGNTGKAAVSPWVRD
ncbi:DUF4232 domain-containing protein [Actinoplanes sp. NEAU-A12]|uniref:DUF4232 domain-containing protein n=1 Tax=Actinoplanes sandaracinus TaxID=3045177 RepID=A0ABT6WPW4_9ACTN|nr:DUF4232 domain-containing protein [Actinoplanes sandaracinus]MDI6101768.1 DUF4232 domain-containing protein [Actinoplanes sandaracinus]